MVESVFSAREIRQLKSRDKPYKVTESAPRGEGRLIVRVHPSGLKEFYYRYRLKERDRLLRIGRFEQTPGDGETQLASLGVNLETRAQLLSHGRSGVQAKHYDRHTYIAEKRRALNKWSQHLKRMISPKPAEASASIEVRQGKPLSLATTA